MENNDIQIIAPKEQLKNSSAVLIMGIASIVCICCGPMTIAGIVLGILAIVLGTKSLKMYRENPDLYTEASMKNAKAGRVCGIIGVSMSVIWAIIVLVIWGTALIGIMMGTFLENM